MIGWLAFSMKVSGVTQADGVGALYVPQAHGEGTAVRLHCGRRTCFASGGPALSQQGVLRVHDWCRCGWCV